MRTGREVSGARADAPGLVVPAVPRPRSGVHDRDAPPRDVALPVVGEERERVAAEADVLGALPPQLAREEGGIGFPGLVADQPSLDLQPDPQHPPPPPRPDPGPPTAP